MKGKKKLGEILMEEGIVNQFQLNAALRNQQQWGGRLGHNLIKLGFISETDLLNTLSKNLNLPSVNLKDISIGEEIIKLVPKDIAIKYSVIPVEESKVSEKRTLSVAMSDPTDLAAIDELQFLAGYKIQPLIALKSDISDAIEIYYESKIKTASQKDSLSLAEDESEEKEKEMVVIKYGDESNLPVEIEEKGKQLFEKAFEDIESISSLRTGEEKLRKLVMSLIQLLVNKNMITKDELLESIEKWEEI